MRLSVEQVEKDAVPTPAERRAALRFALLASLVVWAAVIAVVMIAVASYRHAHLSGQPPRCGCATG